MLHEKSPDPSVLCRRVDRDRTDPDNLRAFIHEIASDDFSITNGNYRIEAGMLKEHRQESRRNLGGRKVWWKAVPFCQTLEGFKADATAFH
jgi:hypothetical protein